MKIESIRNINGIAIALLILSFGMIWALTPYYNDDLWFMMGTYRTDDIFEKFCSTLSNCVEHWFTDNGRLANMISPIFLTLMPKWIFAVLVSLLLWTIIRYARLLANVKSVTIYQWMIIAAVALILPWNDSLFTVIYALNYVFPGALMLFVAYRLVRMSKSEDEFSRRYVVVTAVSAFLCGWSHEGFAVPLAVGLVAYILTIGIKNIPQQLIWIALLVILGLSAQFISPAIWSRIGKTQNIIGSINIIDGNWLWRLVYYGLLYYIFIVVFIVSVSDKYIRTELMSHQRRPLAHLMLLLTIATVGYCLFLFFYTGPRCGFCTQLVSIIGIVYLLNIKNRHKKVNIRCGYMAIIFAVAVFAVTLYVNISAAMLQLKLNKELKEVIQLYQESEDGEVCYDTIPFDKSYINARTSARQLTNGFGIWCISMYYYGDVHKILHFKPTSDCDNGE